MANRWLKLLLCAVFLAWLPGVLMQKEVDDFEGGLEDSPKKYEGKEEEAEREEKGEEDAKEQDQPEELTEVEEGKKSAPGGLGTGLGFFHGFAASISVIIVSEIGDKTFFIAAILAMKSSSRESFFSTAVRQKLGWEGLGTRLIVFAGALSALGLMTFLSVCLGYATMIIPREVTFYACTALLALFGLKMLYEGWKMSPDEGLEEYEEVSAELRKREEMQLTQGSASDPEQGLTTTPPWRRRLGCLGPLLSPILLQAFTLTFLAEWGDRSQLTTIILAARENPVGVTLGGTLGHAFCTALAVIGGKIVAQRISVRTVTIIGGLVFLLFAVTAFLHDPSA